MGVGRKAEGPVTREMREAKARFLRAAARALDREGLHVASKRVDGALYGADSASDACDFGAEMATRGAAMASIPQGSTMASIPQGATGRAEPPVSRTLSDRELEAMALALRAEVIGNAAGRTSAAAMQNAASVYAAAHAIGQRSAASFASERDCRCVCKACADHGDHRNCSHVNACPKKALAGPPPEPCPVCEVPMPDGWEVHRDKAHPPYRRPWWLSILKWMMGRRTS